MNLKRVRSLLVCILPLSLPLFAACVAPSGAGDESAAPDEGSMGVAAQASVTSGTAIQLSGGPVSTLALMSGGTISSWGDNAHSQLGYPTTGPQDAPAPIGGLSGFKAVAAGGG